MSSPSKRWLTAHLPHPIAQAHDVPWHVYLLEEHKEKADEVTAGDLVMFFEIPNVTGVRATEPKKLSVHNAADGETLAEEVLYGLGGQTRYLAEVADGEFPAPMPDDAKAFVYPNQSFEDAQKWSCHIPCKNHRRMPRVSIQTIKEDLKIKKNPNLWGGLIEVTEVEAFDALVEKFAKDFD